MKIRYSLIVTIILVAALTLQSGSSLALAHPELAAAKLTVDDDSQDCPTAGYTSISTALADAEPGNTITVCAGTYTEQLIIDAKPGLKLVGKDMPRIVAPVNADGAVILAQNSSNVTIQGLMIDGNFNFSSSSTSMAGIAFNNSSGTISGNFIRHIRHISLDSSSQGNGILVSGNTSAKPLTVKILSNTITDFQYAGVFVSGNYTPTISRNLIQTATGPNEPSGILLNELPGGSVSSNEIANNHGFQERINTGILLFNSSHVKVASNTITGSFRGVYVQAALLTAEANSISGNRILDCGAGVFITTSASGRANANLVKGNKIITRFYNYFQGGVLVQGGGTAAGNKITGNTIQGYYDLPRAIIDQGTNTVVTGNKWSQFATPGT